MTHQYKLVIFDLDGTLLNTIDDISDAMNEALRRNGFQTYQTSDYRYFVGQGVKVLVDKVLATQDHTENDWQKVYQDYLHFYELWQKNKTHVYPGIFELLSALNKQGIMTAVLSNKPHPDTMRVVDEYFKEHPFACVLGASSERRIKPYPDGVFTILEELKVKVDECLYVGDTKVDMETALSANIFPIGVLWGFRTEEELRRAGASVLIKEPLELLNLLNKEFIL